MEFEAQRAVLREHGYEMKEQIGRGGFAHVFLVSSLRYGLDFAAKVTPYKGNLSGEDVSEIKSLMNLHHPNIINMYDFFVEAGELYVILEYCPLGNLRSYVRSGKLSHKQLQQICAQLASALMVCHSQGIAHRDIKPENVLLDVYGRPKLADFGLGMFCSDRGESTANVNGSLSYSPPEYFTTIHNNPFKSDIWSLGILFYFMATGHVPWHSKGRKEIMKEIAQGVVELNEKLVGKYMNRILRKMLDTNPKHRPDIEEVVTLASGPERSLPRLDGVRHVRSLTSSESIPRVTLKKPIVSFSPRPVYFTCPKVQPEVPSGITPQSSRAQVESPTAITPQSSRVLTFPS